MVTVITKTIGPNPPLPAPPEYDYTNFTDAEADVENIATLAFGSTDLVASDGAIVFEAEAGTYNEAVAIGSTLTTDSTRNVTYKPATGAGHGGVFGDGVYITSSSTYTIRVDDDFTNLVGLCVETTAPGIYATITLARGIVFDGLIGRSPSSVFLLEAQDVTHTTVIKNCVALVGSNVGFYTFRTIRAQFINCTAIQSYGLTANYAYRPVRLLASETHIVDITNCVSYCANSYSATNLPVTVTGSNNFGGSSLPFPVATQGSPYPITASTAYDPGAGNYALYVASNGALLDSPNNDVIGKGLSFLDGAGDVPGYDIIGNPRGAKISNPGAFEIPQGPTVVTKTIGSGKDFPDFTAAEAAVESIATVEFGSTDLVANNGAIVFEADAGTYNEAVTFNSTLTTDATRNVTYRAAAGSEHGGIADAGVFVDASGIGRAFDIRDANTRLIQLSGRASTQQACFLFEAGAVFQNCIFESTGNSGVSLANDAGLVAENCVVRYKSNGFYPYIGTGYAASLECINCTVISNPAPSGYDWQIVGAGGAVTASLVNCLSLGARAYIESASSGGTTTVTGSNNFGGSTDPFPVALQGSPYPITATTDTDPGPGDWAIYDAATGALIDDPDNDVLGGGVGPDANADVPTTDILGNIRFGDTTDPGAFQRPALNTTMTQIYQQDAPFTIGASPSGVSGITHQPGPAALDYFTINSTTSETITVPRTAHALRIVCAIAAKACDVTLELDASNSVYLGTIGGVASVQADLEYFWSFASVASDGAYPRVKIEYDGVFSGDQLVYLWWHLA